MIQFYSFLDQVTTTIDIGLKYSKYMHLALHLLRYNSCWVQIRALIVSFWWQGENPVSILTHPFSAVCLIGEHVS